MVKIGDEEKLAAIEAMLFVSGEAVSIKRLSDALEISKDEIINLLDKLSNVLDEHLSGLKVIKIEDKYQLCSNPIYSEYVKKIMNMKKNITLSSASMEVLAIVAYNQPVTKAFIEQTRGVDCSTILSNLINKDLICEKGRLELPGRPLLYGTTDNFLKCLGITSLDFLPKLENKNGEGGSKE